MGANRISGLLSAMLAASLLIVTSCSDVRQAGSSVTVRISNPQPGGASRVRLQVIDDKIIRVTAVPDGRFNDKGSLAVIPQAGCRDYSVVNGEETVTVSTSSISAVVDKTGGRVSFIRPDGKVILAEQAGGREFIPIEVEGTKGYTVTQRFDSPSPDEAIYGLGQHQSEEFNYKGKSEELYQYNTKVSVPFVISTGGYGILWDSYSYCRFGNPAASLPLSEAFTLYDADGAPGYLTGIYTAADGRRLARKEENISFDHLKRGDLGHVEGLQTEIPLKGAVVTYEGELEGDRDGVFDFILYYSGYVRVWIDSVEVVPERWRTAWNPNSYKFSYDFAAGRRYPVRIQWKPDGDVAYCSLRAFKPVDPQIKENMCWWGEMQQSIDYYFIAGDNADEVIHGCRTLTGKAPVMPKWAMGFWQSREKYNTQEEVLATVAEYRRRGIPIDNIVIDWLHWKQDSWGSHEFDRERFPDPKGMVDSIHAMNARVMISVWPKFYVTTEHYKEFDSKGWMYQGAVRDSIRDWVGPGYLGSFYDAYDSGARKLFWQQIYDHYYPLGIDAWWMDASEPNVRDCVDMDYRKALCGPTALGSSTEYFNAYALMNAEAIYDGQRSVDPDKRVFLLTRSGFVGQQRYSTATWSGDIATRWEDMRAQITAGLNFSVTGVPYWTMDIGGFCVEDRYVAAQQLYDRTGIENEDLKEWRELNTRWYQFGCFVPLFRAHGQWPFREIYNIAPEDHPAYESMTWYTRLRYRLMPYLYSLAGSVTFDDYTIMRPLAMDFPQDKEVYDIGSQYMFGPAFMVAPVTEYKAETKDVYFPDGALWYDMYTGRAIEGGHWENVALTYSRMPLYVRAGSIVSVGEPVQWSGENPSGPVDLYVYAGADGSFTLYEDNGLDYAYERGEYSRIPVSWDDSGAVLTIGTREGEYPGMPVRRLFNVRLVREGIGFGEACIEASVDYCGEEVRVEL
ncbi:MAG: TIM-barrel domain-containing protein [Candidatus Cryptobacteroides sp.]